jgi:hypothetical protein
MSTEKGKFILQASVKETDYFDSLIYWKDDGESDLGVWTANRSDATPLDKTAAQRKVNELLGRPSPSFLIEMVSQ